MDELWDVLKPTIPGLIVALVGIAGTIWVARSNQRSARDLASVTANHNLRTQRTIERDKAARERRAKRIDWMLDQVQAEVEQIIALQNALESGIPDRITSAMEPMTGRVRRPLAPAVAAIPEAEIRVGFQNLFRLGEQARTATAESLLHGQVPDGNVFNITVMLPMMQQLAELHRTVDAYVLGPEP